LAFGRLGDAVVVADVNDNGGQGVVQKITSGGGQAAYTHLDVACEEDWPKAIDFTVKTFGKLTTLVNNAGIGGPRALIEDLSLKDFRRVLDITGVSVFLGCKYAARELKKHAGVASVVNIASIMSKVARGRCEL
jgi:NAD(P)-dependent dehydrogenase (short-subunit alcohol dehydrogenase family)